MSLRQPSAEDDGDRVRRTARARAASAGPLRLTHPEAHGPHHFDARREHTQEEAAFALALDPRGYGDPDEGWRHLVASSALEADPAPGAPEHLHVFAVPYGPDDSAFTPVFAAEGAALRVRTEAFTALIGDPAGDAHGEPELTLSAAEPLV
jgi:hypothetical protein